PHVGCYELVIGFKVLLNFELLLVDSRLRPCFDRALICMKGR
ncbi:MAG: hypothetical protein QOJ40_1859, partial [Verrucomicrobiota bacterium]